MTNRETSSYILMSMVFYVNHMIGAKRWTELNTWVYGIIVHTETTPDQAIAVLRSTFRVRDKIEKWEWALGSVADDLRRLGMKDKLLLQGLFQPLIFTS